ncbi:MAG: heavy metal-responsive transcriptional regulator [Isosphaera sp.]|nr:heavy metal-responsive transcriptional regulator [Isosphaera sp.]
MKAFTVGQVARRAGVGVETVRFYERQGLLDEPERKASGYRQYGGGDVAVLRFIRRAKQLGFTLREIKALLALRLDGSATRSDVRAQAAAKLADIGAKIRDLQRMRDALSVLTAACHGDGPATGCPILEALDIPEDDGPGGDDHAPARPRRTER